MLPFLPSWPRKPDFLGVAREDDNVVRMFQFRSSHFIMDPVLATDGGSDQTGGGVQRSELGDGDCGSDRGGGMHIAAC